MLLGCRIWAGWQYLWGVLPLFGQVSFVTSNEKLDVSCACSALILVCAGICFFSAFACCFVLPVAGALSLPPIATMVAGMPPCLKCQCSRSYEYSCAFDKSAIYSRPPDSIVLTIAWLGSMTIIFVQAAPHSVSCWLSRSSWFT